MKTKTTLSVLALAIAITLFSCEGKQGATGPAGAANIYSTEISVDPALWSLNAGETAYYYQLILPDANISSAVLMYIYVTNASGEAEWTALPFGNYSGTFESDQVEFDYNSIEPPTSGVTFDVIVIPQPQVAKMKLHNINLSDYYQVKEYIKANN